MHLTLLVPELVWPEPEDSAALTGLPHPELSTLLGRGRLTRSPSQPFETHLTTRFGRDGNSPHAPFRLLGETGMALDAEHGAWACCDPVHLRLHQDRLILADSARLDISLDEAHSLVAALNEQLPDLGRFHVATAGRWYLRLAAETQAALAGAPPLSAVSGRRIERMLPETHAAKKMRSLLNEMQMLLHAHTGNQRRENEGRMTINSLWLWGAGSLPERIESTFDGVWCSHPLARGLALAAGVPAHPAPLNASTLLEHSLPDTRHFVVLDELHDPVLDENAAAYRSAVAELETRWFAPLRAALSLGKIRQLHIAAPTAYGTLEWKIQRHDLWKLWRSPQPLSTLARQLSKGTA